MIIAFYKKIGRNIEVIIERTTSGVNAAGVRFRSIRSTLLRLSFTFRLFTITSLVRRFAIALDRTDDRSDHRRSVALLNSKRPSEIHTAHLIIDHSSLLLLWLLGLNSFGLGSRRDRNRNRGMWVTVMCRRRPAGAATRIDDRPDDARNRRELGSAKEVVDTAIWKELGPATKRCTVDSCRLGLGAPTPSSCCRCCCCCYCRRRSAIIVDVIVRDHRDGGRGHRHDDVTAGCCHRARGRSEMRSRRARVRIPTSSLRLPSRTQRAYAHVFPGAFLTLLTSAKLTRERRGLKTVVIGV